MTSHSGLKPRSRSAVGRLSVHCCGESFLILYSTIECLDKAGVLHEGQAGFRQNGIESPAFRQPLAPASTGLYTRPASIYTGLYRSIT